jgi:DNA-binding IscR family transcriptional regulator
MTELSINLILADKLGLQQATLIAYFISLQGESTSFTVATKAITQVLPFNQRTVRKLVAEFRIAKLLTVTRGKNGKIDFAVEKAALNAIT